MLEIDRMYLRPSDVARQLGLTTSAVYKMMERGELPRVRFGRAVRIPGPAFEAWLRARDAGEFVPLREGGEGPASGPLDASRAGFIERTGRVPEDFVDAWRRGEIADDGESTALMIEALSLREAPQQPTNAVYQPSEAEASAC